MQLDIKGPLPETPRGFKYILCLIDTFSKWVETVPLSQIDAKTVAESMVTSVVLRHGVPETIHSDQGRQFESELFGHVCSMLGASKSRTSPFHPSGNGGVERFNRTMGDMLAAFCSDSQNDWDRLLPYVTWAYNSAVHSSTGMSPFRVLHGLEPRLPVDLLLGGELESPADCVELEGRIRRGFEVVRKNLETSQQRQHESYNKETTESKLKVGDLVLLSNRVLKKGKCKALNERWTGPYEIIKVLGEVNFRIRLLQPGRRKRQLIVHHDRLKRFVARTNYEQPRDDDQPTQPKQPGTKRSTEEQHQHPIDLWEKLRDTESAGNDGPRRSTRTRRPPNFFIP